MIPLVSKIPPRLVSAGLGFLLLCLGTACPGDGVGTNPGTRSDGGDGPGWATTQTATTTTLDRDAGAGQPRDAPSGPDLRPERGPAAPLPNVRFPFLQNRESARCVYPRDYRNEDVQAAYQQWKDDTVTREGAGGHLRVKRPKEPGLEVNSTVSEGIAYGMLLAVYMNDQPLFDELWKYSQLWLNNNGLMDWYINAAGTTRLGTGAATDADEDIAFALVMADRQWGGKGTLDKTYLQHAREQIGKVWKHEVLDGKLIKPGDAWGDWHTVNVSYFAPSYYRVFAKIDGNQAGWDAVIKTSYDTIANTLNAANRNQTNGLVPAWCTSDGAPNGGVFGGAPTHYQYDSCRTPFRIGLDWCWFGDTRARDYLAKTTAFFSGIGVRNISDGYNLDGSPRPENPGKGSAAFVGPAAVGAMSVATAQTFIDEAYAQVATRQLLAGGVYYEDSWTVLSLLALTGGFLDFTAL